MKLTKNKKFNSNVSNLNRIEDFFDDRFKYLRLEKNERLELFPRKLIVDFFNSLSSDDFSAYAELGSTYSAITKKFKLKNNNLLLTAGSDLAIKSVIQSLIEKDDEVVTFEPGYAMTEVYTKMFGGKTISLKYNKNFNVNYQKIISNLSNKTKLVVIENPSGFTGQMPDRASILKLLKLLNKKNIFLLVDEAYIFLNQIKYSFFNKIGEYSNLIISWSFSKAHGLAGMRAGCIISCEDNMKYIKNTRPLHEITSLTSNFLKLIISKDYILEDYKRKLNETKKFIFQSLDEINIRYLDTKTNFFLIYIEEPEDFRLFLFNKGILVRRSFKLKGLNNWIRICIPPYKKRRFFVNIIKLWNKN